MKLFEPLKKGKNARVGLYSIGLEAYWDQFKGMKERLEGYGRFIESELMKDAEIFNFGMVDSVDKSKEAGEWFNEKNVDLIFCHSATYSTSSTVLPIHQICPKPFVILNLQPTERINYDETTTGEWLAHCGACPVPELANVFNRAQLPFKVINGLLGNDHTPNISVANENTKNHPSALKAWKEMKEWVKAAGVVRTLRNARFGFLGNTYNGMLDMYSDFTMIQSQTGIHVEILEMNDLDTFLQEVKVEEIEEKKQETLKMFELSGDSPSDPIAKKPTDEQMEWSAKVAVAQEKLIKEYDLDALTYYYHGSPGSDFENLQAGFILGNSLLTAKGIPCAGEGDLKTAIAMKICDLLGTGGSYSEIVVVDYQDETILLGHDGPFHLEIAEGKPLLRGMGLYHGKQGSGISVEAKVKSGPITTFNMTQTHEDGLKMIFSEGFSTNGPTMKIGNTQTPVKFPEHPDEYMSRWFNEAPTHHSALSIGHNRSQFEKVAELLNMKHVSLTD